jgi:hypothetical protein
MEGSSPDQQSSVNVALGTWEPETGLNGERRGGSHVSQPCGIDCRPSRESYALRATSPLVKDPRARTLGYRQSQYRSWHRFDRQSRYRPRRSARSNHFGGPLTARNAPENLGNIEGDATGSFVNDGPNKADGVIGNWNVSNGPEGNYKATVFSPAKVQSVREE